MHTTKGLAATNAVPSGLEGSLGIELRKAVEEGSPSNLSRIGDLIGGFFGGFTKVEFTMTDEERSSASTMRRSTKS